MSGGELIGLTAVILIFGTPIFAMIASVLKAKYRAEQSSLSDKDRDAIERLNHKAGDMSDRIATLESILDHEVPGWRDDHESR